MHKILVTYASQAGSTAKVAQAIAHELGKTAEVELLPLEKVTHLEAYSAIVLGAPMILGWHRAALAFLKRQAAPLSRVPLAIFVTCLSLTETGETELEGIPLWVDEKLPRPAKNPGRLSFKENHTTLKNYVTPILRAAPGLKPVSIGVFGGSLQYFNLPGWAALFALLVVQATPGDRRNWPAIETWARSLFVQA